MVGWSAQGLPLVLLLALLPLPVAAQTNPAAPLPALPSVVLETFPESAWRFNARSTSPKPVRMTPRRVGRLA